MTLMVPRPIKACSSRPAIQSQSFETWQALGLKFQEEPAGLASRLAAFVHSVTAYPVKSPQQQISPRTSEYPDWPSRPRFLAFWAILVSACPLWTEVCGPSSRPRFPTDCHKSRLQLDSSEFNYQAYLPGDLGAIAAFLGNLSVGLPSNYTR